MKTFILTSLNLLNSGSEEGITFNINYKDHGNKFLSERNDNVVGSFQYNES
jgi:hypothetical protein